MKERAQRPEPTPSTEVPRKRAILEAVTRTHFAERNGRVGKPAVRLWTPAGRDNVIIPATGLEDFLKIAEEMVTAAAEIPGKDQ
jgi:hypothetical protein